MSASEWVSAGSSAATAVVAVVALVIALRQLGEARSARTLTSDLDRARSQPYVVIFMEPSAASQHVIDLVIRNYGQTAARDVRVQVTPMMQRSLNSQPGVTEAEAVDMPDLIPFMAPGQEWRAMWDQSPDRLQSSLPARHVAEVDYLGIDGMALRSESVLDWSMYRGRRWVEVRGLHDLAKSMKAVEKSLSGMVEPLSNGVRVWTRDGHAKDAAQRREYFRRFPDAAPPSPRQPPNKRR